MDKINYLKPVDLENDPLKIGGNYRLMVYIISVEDDGMFSFKRINPVGIEHEVETASIFDYIITDDESAKYSQTRRTGNDI
jgi:hypothetical protein